MNLRIMMNSQVIMNLQVIMNPQAMLKFLLGANEGDIMYAIYSAYANKITGKETGQGFDVDKDGYLPICYNAITGFTGLLPDTVRGVIGRLIKKGLLQKKPGNKETNNIPLYKPVLESSVFIELANERLKTPPKDGLNKKSEERFIPEIIKILQGDSNILVALGIIERSDD